MTTFPLSRCALAPLAVNGSAILTISTAVMTTEGTPICSRVSFSARQFITVASIPMLSALVLSILPLERPRQKFPPPITMPISAPISRQVLILLHTVSTIWKSIPVPLSPASTSPESLSSILLKAGSIYKSTPSVSFHIILQ